MNPFDYLNSLPKWSAQPSCAGFDPEIFFPVEDTLKAIKPAVSICERCPALKDCYKENSAVEQGWSGGRVWGVYAGLAERYRKPIHDYLYCKEQIEIIDRELKTGKRAIPSESPRKSRYLCKAEKESRLRKREKFLQSLPQKKHKAIKARESYMRWLEHCKYGRILELVEQEKYLLEETVKVINKEKENK